MFTYEEIIEDWRKIDNAITLADKVEISRKYNSPSNAVSVIKASLICEMNAVRKERTEFDIRDIVWFNRNISSTDNYKKLSHLLSLENSYFVEFYKNYYYNKLVERKLLNKHSSMMNQADKYLVKTYQNIEKFIKENSSEHIEAINREAKIADILNVQLDSYYKESIERTKKSAENFYTNVFPIHFENKKNKYNTAKEKFNELQKKLNVLMFENSPELNKFMKTEYFAGKRQCEEALTELKKWKLFANKYPTLESYIKYSLNELERHHKRAITTLSERINRRAINIDKMQVLTVRVDPNLYNMTVTDGVEHLYCRSVWCAEYSEKVTPHYRFIIS